MDMKPKPVLMKLETRCGCVQWREVEPVCPPKVWHIPLRAGLNGIIEDAVAFSDNTPAIRRFFASSSGQIGGWDNGICVFRG